MPLMTMNSNALSKHCGVRTFLADDRQNLVHVGLENLVSMFSSRAIILSTLPRMVLISPLCTMIRFGMGAHPAQVCVGAEAGECTVAMADS